MTVTQQMADLFKDGIAPPLGTYSYDAAPAAFAAGKLAILSSDLATTTALPSPMPFKWKLLPYPPGPVSQVNFNDITYYMINAKSPDKDLMWEVVKWWTSGPNDAYWADNSGTYPARTDAAASGYGKSSAPQLAEALPLFEKYAVGLENFAAMGDRRAARRGGDPELLRRQEDRPGGGRQRREDREARNRAVTDGAVGSSRVHPR